MPLVKGLAFRSVMGAHAEQYGKDGMERVFACLGPELSAPLRYVVASTWYPVGDYAKLWDALMLTVGSDSNYPREVGRKCIARDLTLVHRLALSMLSVNTMMDISSRLFSSYYDTGRCTSTRIAERITRVDYVGCTGFTEPMWTELRGATEGLVGLATKTTASTSVISGGARGNSDYSIEVTWQKPR